ncbi:hypothetical protein EVAR_68673_1 [Eumeta japonica]|uniref:Uncharacterized protein n=1 Tax=Eumeta variegata TaxID=151549 RepID=A0A4C1SU60_EUMVA|nr:hypothetical protein EVAR_68673_1 [Eumeta japonica]
MTASPNAAGQHTGVTTTRDMPYGRFLKGSPRHRMSLDTDTGRVHLSYPARKRPDGMGVNLYPPNTESQIQYINGSLEVE